MEKIAKTPTNDGLLGLLGAPPPPPLYSPAPVSSMVARPSATPTPTLLALEDIKEDELPQAQQQEDGWEEVMFFWAPVLVIPQNGALSGGGWVGIQYPWHHLDM